MVNKDVCTSAIAGILFAHLTVLSSAILPQTFLKDALRGSGVANGTDPPPLPQESKIFIDPALDGRREIANYNRFMDVIFRRMNAAIRAKDLDPMDLKILPNMIKEYKQRQNKVPRFDDNSKDMIEQRILEENARKNSMNEVKAMLHGMSSLNRTGDVLIFFHESGERTVQCPFSLGPLELIVSKSVAASASSSSAGGGGGGSSGGGARVKRRSAKAVTELMLGLMDIRIDPSAAAGSGKAEITDVIFDEPGGVDVQGSLKRRANTKDEHILPYKLMLAAKAALSLGKVARLVADPPES